MIEWLREFVVPNFEDEELNRRAFNLNVILLLTLIVMLLGIVAMVFQIGKRPLSYLLPNLFFIVIAAIILMICYYLSRRGRVQAGSIIFVAMMTFACIGAVVVGGTRGALGVILIIPLAAAGTTLGVNASLALSFLSVGTLVVVGLLENNGIILVEYPEPEITVLLNMFDVGFSLVFVTLSIWLAGYSLRLSLARTEQAASEAKYYQQEVEQSLAAEQATRDRLVQAIQDYTSFLDRIGQKEYTARLSLSEDDENLAHLEQQLNATVETLVSALTESESARMEVEAAHQRYLLQSWHDYTKTAAKTQFDFSGHQDEEGVNRLSPTLQEALEKGDLITSESDSSSGTEPGRAAIPIKLRGQVIGVIGIQRDENPYPWTDREQALIESVTERLGLSIDALRLLEDTQRRAAHDRLVSDITSKIRQTLDVDTVLRNAVNEMRKALRLKDVMIRLEAPQDTSRERTLLIDDNGDNPNGN